MSSKPPIFPPKKWNCKLFFKQNIQIKKKKRNSVQVFNELLV